MYGKFQQYLQAKVGEIKTAGLYKQESIINGPQQVIISPADRSPVLNLCANNYLGLANHPAIVEAARQALQEWGYGLASVRFICGTQSIHKQLEERISAFLGTEDTILYGSCFDANGGLFETLLDSDDAQRVLSLYNAEITKPSQSSRFRGSDTQLLETALSVEAILRSLGFAIHGRRREP